MVGKNLTILPFGGLGEIGMNCMLIGWNNEFILVDCGVQFPDASYTGVDILTPDFSYVIQNIKGLRGIVVTHGHDDHIGAIPFLSAYSELDVYVTPFPQGLIQQKFAESPSKNEIRYHEISPRKLFKVGPFEVDPIPVQHSIIESLALAIKTPVGTVIHSGDFKHDANEMNGSYVGFEPFKEYGDKGVLLLMSDSTNAERAGHTLSEVDISKSFDKFFREQAGRLLIALFASNIRRVESLLRIAAQYGKKVAFCGRSMHSYTKLAHDLAALNIPPDTLVLVEDIQKFPDKEVVILLTGSQAEPRSALLRIAHDEHKDVKIRAGDTVILSSRFIPGNERNITSMIDHLYRMGAEVLYESIHQIHVSGHGFQEELLMMLNAARPKFFIPIHGEYRHMAKHAKLARGAGVLPENVAVIEDGQGVEIDGNTIKRLEPIALNKQVYMEGVLLTCNAALLKERNNLSKTGIIFAAFYRDKATKRLLQPPKVATQGLLYREGFDPVQSIQEAEDHLKEFYPEHAKREDVYEHLRIEMRRFFRKRTSHKPAAIPLLVDI